MPIKVALIEDNAGISAEIERILGEDPECRCVGVCRNLQTALKKIPAMEPDVIIVDIRLPDGSGIDAVTRLKRLLPSAQMMMYTVFEDSEQIFRALEAGANGYLLKDTPPAELLRAIREIREGGVPMTGEVARKVIESFRGNKETTQQLSPREEQILHLLSKGYLYKEIAGDLAISTQTVNSHLKRIYEKLHVRTRTEAVIKFLR